MSNANSDQNKGPPIRIIDHEVVYKYYVAQEGEGDIKFVWLSQNSNKLTQEIISDYWTRVREDESKGMHCTGIVRQTDPSKKEFLLEFKTENTVKYAKNTELSNEQRVAYCQFLENFLKIKES